MALQEELKNKEELLRNEQEEKEILAAKLTDLQKMFEKKESVPE